MWETAPFPHVKYASDFEFVSAARDKGCRLDHFADTEGLCLHACARTTCPRAFRRICCRIHAGKAVSADLSRYWIADRPRQVRVIMEL